MNASRNPVIKRDAARFPAGNVIPFRGSDDGAAVHSFPTLRLGENDRPAPLVDKADARLRFLLLLFASLCVHAAIFTLWRTEPETMASVGEVAITVELIVGADSAAGTAQAKSDVEAEQQPAVTNQNERRQEKLVEDETPEPTEQKVTAVEETIASRRELPPAKERNSEEPPPEPKPREPPQPKPTQSAPPAAAANSIGRGRMSAGDANYHGLVAARLARMKRYPPEARRRREQGSAVVSFVIDAGGRVTSVRLVRGTGWAALDEEVQAMVHRASPFPPTPTGAEMSFSAPVSFRLN